MRRSVLLLGLLLAVGAAGCDRGPGLVDAAMPAGSEATTPTPAATSQPVTSTSTTTAKEAGDEPDAGAPSGAPVGDAFPVTITTDNGDVTIATRPEAIVSLSPAATEILFAIGAGDQVIAVDDQSNWPPEAPVSALSGFTPNVEAIAAVEPDLVVLTFDPGDVESSLTDLGIPVIVQFAPVSLKGALSHYEQLGAATGHLAQSADVSGMITSRLAELAGELPAFDPPLTYYHELDDLLYSVTSSTFVGDVYRRLGLISVADPADTAGFGYPQLSAEYLVEADPDLIFLADTRCCAQTAESLAARPGWDQLAAVRSGAVIELDDDVASRWGPRIIEFMETVAGAVAALEPAK